MSDNTLKIRIQIQQPQQAIEQTYPDLPEPEIVYEHSLDWKKIGAAVLLLLSILALIGYFMLGTDKVQPPSNGEAVTATDPATMQENKTPLEELAPESAVKDQSAKTELSQSPAEQNNAADIIQPKDKIQSGKTMNPTGQAAAPVVKSKPEPIIHKPVAVPRNKPESTESTKPILPPEPQNTSDHPQVLRAQLSHDVKAREPVDAIDSIQLRPGKSQPIYFYLHLKNLQGKRVGILWYRNNKLDSQLFLDIRLDNWRTQASKQLDHQRLGTWRVELVDESGNRLATRSFTVTER
ncbi:Protein of unknown function (DUF2914) [Nitrosomonas sp. Nm84]|uniref:DUF2914 domain-containing protein n=1 Tax=Nitrosomonas sp. Nm84 TaxID=200124 RepID=UPI000D775274|nr:DUF2914 domain-containing protein [Nitrosomonas sp. Nm84]PXW82295.1 Protein of unknown function (DUF2914) [Nitrosomonas sp. Nm84]